MATLDLCYCDGSFGLCFLFVPTIKEIASRLSHKAYLGKDVEKGVWHEVHLLLGKAYVMLIPAGLESKGSCHFFCLFPKCNRKGRFPFA